MTPYTFRRLTPADKPEVTRLLVREWGAVEVVALALGGLVDASALPGWLAERDGEVAGLLTYQVTGATADLVTINAFAGTGVGTGLLAALVDDLRRTGVTRLTVTTTNDNTRALRFYQRAGFRLAALRVDAVAEARRIKPGIPELGDDGIPIRDELELIMEISP
ncbi:MAG TPA: GNAT family N-acetyltransferase [Actinophytocola sp.]|nr:GNAT family N-acetyltransferase [Actinophytocola sp.]